MSKHIIPYDHFNHIEDVSCGCNPTISIVEGEEICIHKEMKLTIYKTYPDFKLKHRFDNFEI